MLNTKNSGRENLVLPACLVIMDGYGLSEEGEGNAISLAHTPVLDGLFDQSSWHFSSSHSTMLLRLEMSLPCPTMTSRMVWFTYMASHRDS